MSVTRFAAAGALSALILGASSLTAFAAPTPSIPMPTDIPAASGSDVIYTCTFEFNEKTGAVKLAGSEDAEKTTAEKFGKDEVKIFDFDLDDNELVMVVGIDGVTPDLPEGFCQTVVENAETIADDIKDGKIELPGQKPTKPADDGKDDDRGIPAKTGVEDELPVAPLALLGVGSVALGAATLKRR